MVRELGGRDRLALIAAFVAVVNPISWFDSVVWGQVDSFGVVFLLLGLRELWRDHPERSAIYAVIAALIKPQLGILIPIVARRHDPAGALAGPDDGRGARSSRRRPESPRRRLLARLRAWERGHGPPDPHRDDRARRPGDRCPGLPARSACRSSTFSSTAPFIQSGLLEQIFATAGGYPYLTVNAYNPWALVTGDTGIQPRQLGLWVCDGSWTRRAVRRRASRRSAPCPALAVGDGAACSRSRRRPRPSSGAGRTG